jgi:hypothetical protein
MSAVEQLDFKAAILQNKTCICVIETNKVSSRSEGVYYLSAILNREKVKTILCNKPGSN